MSAPAASGLRLSLEGLLGCGIFPLGSRVLIPTFVSPRKASLSI